MFLHVLRNIFFFFCSYRDSVGFVFCEIFSISFLEGSDLENGSYRGNCRLLEDTSFLSPREYCKHRYRNTVLTSLNWSLQFSFLVKKIPDATLVVFWWFPCAVSLPAGSLITRRHLFYSCTITHVLSAMRYTIGVYRYTLGHTSSPSICPSKGSCAQLCTAEIFLKI